MNSINRTSASIPASAGIGLRSRHLWEIAESKPTISWLEAHSENYFGNGGLPLHMLERIRRDYPLSLHGVGLSLGSTDPLSKKHLQQLKCLLDRFEPGLVSEHLSWSSWGGAYLNDLAPLPYNDETLAHLLPRIEEVQEFLDRKILVENPSSYLTYRDSTYRESEFLAELSRRSGCGVLLDVNNVYVSCANHGWDADTYLGDLSLTHIGEIHLAGHSTNAVGTKSILIDTHDRRVSEPVWALFAKALRLTGPVPILIEWDADVPELSVLIQEARTAEAHLQEVRYGIAC